MNPFKKDRVIKMAREAWEAFEVMGKTTHPDKGRVARRDFNEKMLALGKELQTAEVVGKKN